MLAIFCVWFTDFRPLLNLPILRLRQDDALLLCLGLELRHCTNNVASALRCHMIHMLHASLPQVNLPAPL